MPAGDYSIRRTGHVDPGLLLIRSRDGRHAALFDAREAVMPTAQGTPRLVFDRCGSEEFLRSLQPGGERDDLRFSHAEVQAALAGAHQMVHTSAHGVS